MKAICISKKDFDKISIPDRTFVLLKVYQFKRTEEFMEAYGQEYETERKFLVYGEHGYSWEMALKIFNMNFKVIK